jgi:hypothetical protein
MKGETVKLSMKIGATLGGIAFLIFGIIPGFYFGGYGTLVLLNKLFGSVEPTLLIRMVMVAGITLGIFCIGAVSLVLGAILGTVAGYIVNLLGSLAPAKTNEVTAKK